MSAEGIGGGVRRKRRAKNACPNPLFVKWVEEWRDEARERGVKTQYTYSKALSSLKKYPLPLHSGQEAKILDFVDPKERLHYNSQHIVSCVMQYFGNKVVGLPTTWTQLATALVIAPREKLAKMLDKKLAEYLADTGTEDSPGSAMTTSSKRKASGGGEEQRKQKRPKTASDRSKPTSQSQPRQSSSPTSLSSPSSPSHKLLPSRANSPGKASTQKKKKTPREYIPEYRSGPYAVLVALYNAQKNQPNYSGYMRKSCLIDAAQPYCDTSFTIPDAGSYYTAWSSTSGLIKRGLVNKYSNPPRYSLTAAGSELAERLLQGTIVAVSDVKRISTSPSTSTSSLASPPPHSPNINISPPSSPIDLRSSSVGSPPTSLLSADLTVPYDLSGADSDTGLDADIVRDGNSTSDLNPSRPMPASLNLLQFWYIDPSGKCVENKDQAAVTFNDVVSVGFLVKCRQEQLKACNLTYSLDHCRKPDGPYIYAYLSNEDAPDPCSPPTSGPDTTSTTEHKHLSPSQSRTPPTNEPPIVLCDSDSDMEVVPLFERIGGLGEKGKGKAKTGELGKTYCGSVSGKSQTPTNRACPSCSDAREEVSCGSGDRDKEGQSASLDGGLNSPKNLTPAQMAGMAALRRLKLSKAMRDTEASVPVLDLTDEEAELTPPPAKRSANISSQQEDNGRAIHAIPTPQSPILDLTKEWPDSPPALPGGPSTSRSTAAPSNSMLTISRGGPSGENLDPCSRIAGSSTHSKAPNQLHAPSLAIGAAGIEKEGGQGSPVSVSADLGKPEFVLRPGHFDIVLCIDNSESTASRKSSSQFRGLLLQELGKNGVRFDVRKLNVGDFLWIAKEKTAPIQGSLTLPCSREAVLEYIVERKRMDDLAGSIVDGRFHEQKFRMRNCGVRNPIYLVEEHGDTSHLKITKRTLEQAVTNTQVLSGFFVKRTKDIRESVAYLTLMTRFLQRHYLQSTINVYPWETIVLPNKSPHRYRAPDVVYSMPFKNFNEVSVKNKVLSVYEMFGRQLVHLPQFSADRAAAVLDKYPTIAQLREAYRQCVSEKERENLLSDIRAGPTKRKLGTTLSSLVYSLYWKGQ